MRYNNARASDSNAFFRYAVLIHFYGATLQQTLLLIKFLSLGVAVHSFADTCALCRHFRTLQAFVHYTGIFALCRHLQTLLPCTKHYSLLKIPNVPLTLLLIIVSYYIFLYIKIDVFFSTK